MPEAVFSCRNKGDHSNGERNGAFGEPRREKTIYFFSCPQLQSAQLPLRRARLCSYILLLLNFVLTGAVMMILFVDKGFTYHGILIYFMAAYTFYITTHAIISLIKYRKYHSPVMTTSKIIALSAALVSMLALETAMFSQFGGNMARESQQLMIALTGAAVSAVVIALSVFMIVKGTREIKTLRQGKSENN